MIHRVSRRQATIRSDTVLRKERQVNSRGFQESRTLQESATTRARGCEASVRYTSCERLPARRGNSVRFVNQSRKAAHKRFVEDHLGGDVHQFASLRSFCLSPVLARHSAACGRRRPMQLMRMTSSVSQGRDTHGVPNERPSLLGSIGFTLAPFFGCPYHVNLNAARMWLEKHSGLLSAASP